MSTEPYEGVVKVDFDNGVAWVTLNRPDKRNCMNPTLNRVMHDVLDDLEDDEQAVTSEAVNRTVNASVRSRVVSM